MVCLTVAALYVVVVAKISKTLAADAVPLETERYRFGRLRVTSANNMAVTSSDATTGESAGAVTEVTAMLAKPAMPGEFKLGFELQFLILLSGPFASNKTESLGVGGFRFRSGLGPLRPELSGGMNGFQSDQASGVGEVKESSDDVNKTKVVRAESGEMDNDDYVPMANYGSRNYGPREMTGLAPLVPDEDSHYLRPMSNEIPGICTSFPLSILATFNKYYLNYYGTIIKMY